MGICKAEDLYSLIRFPRIDIERSGLVETYWPKGQENVLTGVLVNSRSNTSISAVSTADIVNAISTLPDCKEPPQTQDSSVSQVGIIIRLLGSSHVVLISYGASTSAASRAWIV